MENVLPMLSQDKQVIIGIVAGGAALFLLVVIALVYR